MCQYLFIRIVTPVLKVKLKLLYGYIKKKNANRYFDYLLFTYTNRNKLFGIHINILNCISIMVNVHVFSLNSI